MRFADIPGNEACKQALLRMADTGRVPHALLLYENDGGGAFALAMAWLQYLACEARSGGDSCGKCPACTRMSKLIHPDVHFVYPTNTGSKSGNAKSKDITSAMYMKDFLALAGENPFFTESDLYDAIGIEGKSGDINVAEASSIIRKLSLPPVENGYQAVVMFECEKLGTEAANKLLKIIEEPPANTIFLFITHNPDKVLQTILSRCQGSRVVPMGREDVQAVLSSRFGVDGQTAGEIAGICGGSVGAALDALRGKEAFDKFGEITFNLLNALADNDLSAALKAADAISAIDDREKQKAFCIFASGILRKIFLIQWNMEGIAYVSPDEKKALGALAARLPKTFCRTAQTLFDRTATLLERNVYQKILFCDLADRLYAASSKN